MIEWHTGQRARALTLARRLRDELGNRTRSAAMLGHLRGVIMSATGLLSALSGELDDATQDLRTAYPAALETQDQPIIAAVGTAVAGWLAARERFTEAAVALGAAAATRGADDWSDMAVTAIADMLRERLGDDFDAGYAEGPVVGSSRKITPGRPTRGPASGSSPAPRTGCFDHIHDVIMTSLADITRTRRCHECCPDMTSAH